MSGEIVSILCYIRSSHLLESGRLLLRLWLYRLRLWLNRLRLYRLRLYGLRLYGLQLRRGQSWRRLDATPGRRHRHQLQGPAGRLPSQLVRRPQQRHRHDEARPGRQQRLPRARHALGGCRNGHRRSHRLHQRLCQRPKDGLGGRLGYDSLCAGLRDGRSGGRLEAGSGGRLSQRLDCCPGHGLMYVLDGRMSGRPGRGLGGSLG